MSKKRIAFFEAPGGRDKGADGHRKDTLPMAQALRARGFEADIIFYTDEQASSLCQHVIKNYDGFVSRVNPGTIPSGEAQYFQFLKELSEAGLKAFPHPDTMQNFGSKDSLVKLAGTPLVPEDTYAYYNLNDLIQRFPLSLSYGPRVLKQNRGSTGSGIWRVEALSPTTPGTAVPLNTLVQCTEAADNHVEQHKLGDFMRFCEQYLVGAGGQLVDMRFLPRITEGEIRILLVGPHIVFIVHKKPVQQEHAFSATLFSGATYTYDSADKWPKLVSFFHRHLDLLKTRLGCLELPLIWTADFILDTAPNGEDSYILGEVNCSCVGFTSDLDKGIQDLVAQHIIESYQKDMALKQ